MKMENVPVADMVVMLHLGIERAYKVYVRLRSESVPHTVFEATQSLDHQLSESKRTLEMLRRAAGAPPNHATKDFEFEKAPAQLRRLILDLRTVLRLALRTRREYRGMARETVRQRRKIRDDLREGFVRIEKPFVDRP